MVRSIIYLVCTQFRSTICKPTVIKILLQLFQMKYLLLNTIGMELRCPFSIHKQINSWTIPTGNNSNGFVPCLLFHGYVILKRSHGRFEPLQDKGIVPLLTMFKLHTEVHLNSAPLKMEPFNIKNDIFSICSRYRI